MSNKPKKILAINFGGIGDEILFFPTLETVKKTFQNCHITLVTEPRSASCKNLTTLIDEIITCDIKSKSKYLELLKFLIKVHSQKFDVVISSGGSKMVSILLFLTGIKTKYGFNSGKLSELLLTKTVELKKQQYAVNMYHDLTKPFAPNAVCNLPQIDISDQNLEWAKNIIGNNNKKLVLIHPGVSQMSIQKNIIKFWETQKWSDLVLRLLKTGEFKVILAGGPDDEMTVSAIRKNLLESNIDSSNLIDTFGQTRNIAQLAALIKLSNVMVCVDSAPMHIAVGARTNLVALFGPTDDKKLVPENDSKIAVIKNEKAQCRPCLWDKRQVSCENRDCLNISVDDVFDSALKFLQD